MARSPTAKSGCHRRGQHRHRGCGAGWVQRSRGPPPLPDLRDGDDPTDKEEPQEGASPHQDGSCEVPDEEDVKAREESSAGHAPASTRLATAGAVATTIDPPPPNGDPPPDRQKMKAPAEPADDGTCRSHQGARVRIIQEPARGGHPEGAEEDRSGDHTEERLDAGRRVPAAEPHVCALGSESSPARRRRAPVSHGSAHRRGRSPSALVNVGKSGQAAPTMRAGAMFSSSLAEPVLAAAITMRNGTRERPRVTQRRRDGRSDHEESIDPGSSPGRGDQACRPTSATRNSASAPGSATLWVNGEPLRDRSDAPGSCREPTCGLVRRERRFFSCRGRTSRSWVQGISVTVTVDDKRPWPFGGPLRVPESRGCSG